MMRWRMVLVAVSVVGLVAAGCGDDSDDASDETTTTTEESTTTSVADTTTSQPDDATSDEVPLSGGEVELSLDPAVVPAVPGPVEVVVDGTVPQGWMELLVMVCPEWEGPDAPVTPDVADFRRPESASAGPGSCGFDEEANTLRERGLLANVTVSDFEFSTTLTVEVDRDMIVKGGVTILAGDIMVPVGGWTTLQISDPTDDEPTAAEPVDEVVPDYVVEVPIEYVGQELDGPPGGGPWGFMRTESLSGRFEAGFNDDPRVVLMDDLVLAGQLPVWSGPAGEPATERAPGFPLRVTDGVRLTSESPDVWLRVQCPDRVGSEGVGAVAVMWQPPDGLPRALQLWDYDPEESTLFELDPATYTVSGCLSDGPR